MAVIDLRGEGSIPDSIRRLGGAAAGVITSIKHPHKEDRDAFTEALRNNPALGERLAALDKRSPGFIDTNFGFLSQEVRDNIRAIAPSAAQRVESITEGALTPEEEGGDLPSEMQSILQEFARTGAFGTDPVAAAGVTKQVTAVENLTQEDVDIGTVRRARGLTEGGEAQDAFNAETFNTASKAFDDLELTDQKKASLRAKLPAVFHDADVAETFRQRMAIAQMQLDATNIDRANERTDAFQRSIAARWVTTTNVGTPETWQEFFFNKELNARAKGLADGSIAVGSEGGSVEGDIRLFEVATAFERADQVDKIVQESAVQTQIRAIITRISARDREGKFANNRSVRLALAEQLNKAFVELSILTDDRIPIRIAEIPESRVPFRLGNKALVIRDAEGNEVDLGVDTSGVEPDTSEGQQGPVLNFNTVDSTNLSQTDRENLIKLITGQGTVEQLEQQAPNSLQRILDARINR